jgi:hypothetical protein
MKKDYSQIGQIISWLNDIGVQSETLFNRIYRHLKQNYKLVESYRYAPFLSKRLFATPYYVMGLKKNKKSDESLEFMLTYTSKLESSFSTHEFFDSQPALNIMKISKSTGGANHRMLLRFLSDENTTLKMNSGIISGNSERNGEQVDIECIVIPFEKFDGAKIKDFLKKEIESSVKKLGFIP